MSFPRIWKPFPRNVIIRTDRASCLPVSMGKWKSNFHQFSSRTHGLITTDQLSHPAFVTLHFPDCSSHLCNSLPLPKRPSLLCTNQSGLIPSPIVAVIEWDQFIVALTSIWLYLSLAVAVGKMGTHWLPESKREPHPQEGQDYKASASMGTGVLVFSSCLRFVWHMVLILSHSRPTELQQITLKTYSKPSTVHRIRRLIEQGREISVFEIIHPHQRGKFSTKKKIDNYRMW